MSAQPILFNGGSSNQSIYDVVTSPKHTVGTRGFLPDGRVFYYTGNTTAAALTLAELQVAPEREVLHSDLPTGTTCMVLGASVITDVTVGAAAIAANDFAWGYINVNSGTGIGSNFQVRSHLAIASAGTGNFNIFGSIHTASGATTTVDLFRNPYSNPQQGNADQLDVPVGVPVVTIPAGSTTPQYGWLQTWGPCSVLMDESITAIAQAVTIGGTLVGAVEEDNTATTVSQEFIVGYTMAAATDTDCNMVDLRIRP